LTATYIDNYHNMTTETATMLLWNGL